MARVLNFSLTMKDGYKVERDIADLREHFDLETVLGLYKEGKLQRWLKQNKYAEEAAQLDDLDEDAPDFTRAFCRILGVEAVNGKASNDRGMAAEVTASAQHQSATPSVQENSDEVTLLRERGEQLRDEEKYEEAKECFERAAELGDGEAMNALGLLYFNGNLGEEDYWTAARYFERSAEADCGVGAANFARCFEHGWGVAENWKNAVKYYEMARDLGDEDARRHLKLNECFGEALAELLGSIMHGKLRSGQKLWEGATGVDVGKFLYKPWGQGDIDAFLKQEGKSSLDYLRNEDGNIDETIIGTLVMTPRKEEYKGASGIVNMIGLASKLPGVGGISKLGVQGAKLAVLGVKTLHNALKSSMRIIFTNQCVYFDDICIPYTTIKDVAVVENEETEWQPKIIQVVTAPGEELWELPLHKYIGLASAPLALFLAAAARLYGNYGNFGRELSDEEAMHLSRIMLSVLDDECILDYL